MGGGGADGTGGMPGPGGGASPGEGGGGSASGGIGNCASATDAEQCSERGCFPVTMTPRLRLGGMGGEGGFGFASDCMEEAQEEEFIGCANGEGGGPGDVCFCRKGNWRECAFGGPEVPWVTDDWISASCDYVGCTRFQ